MTGPLLELNLRVNTLSDEALLQLATVESSKYTPDSLSRVREELARRGITDISAEHYERLKGGGTIEKKSSMVQSFLNPPLHDVTSARRASFHGMIAALLAGTFTTCLAILAALDVKAVTVLGANIFALLDAGIFFAVAFGIWRGSRVAAVFGLIFFVLEKIHLWVTAGLGPGIIVFAMVVAFVNGVRGTFALRTLRTKGRLTVA